MNIKKVLFFLIILIQIGLIFFLFFLIQRKKNDILGVSVYTINSNTIQKIPSNEFVHFYEPKPNTTEEIHKEWLPYIPRYTTNAEGFYDRYSYELIKKKGAFRIMNVGDSFTAGAYVDTKDNFSELLEDKLNGDGNSICKYITKYEVINLGVGAYDNAYSTERYIRRGKKYNSNIILFTITDFTRVTEHKMANQYRKIFTAAEKKSWEKKGIYSLCFK